MADDPNTQSAGTVETKAEFRKTPPDFAKHWLEAIDMAGTDEKDWRTAAEDCLKRYSKGATAGFNILYANTQTTVPALYNSEPAPDVRRRFDLAQPTPPQMGHNGGPPMQPGAPPPPPDPAVQQAMMAYQGELAKLKQKQDDSKQVSTALERALSVQSERYNFDGAMQAAVRDRQLPGRGVTRVRVTKGQNGTKALKCEPVQWDDFRHGPGKTFDDWTWIGFRHRMTRDELVELNPTLGRTINLDAVVSGADEKKSSDLHDMFKRAVVWEVWDKSERRVYFFAESHKDGPLADLEDPYELRDFFCIPQPLYQVPRTTTTTPICEFTLWKALADEVDKITTRIIGLIKVLKARGLYDGAYAAIVEKLKGLDDGEMAAADDAGRSMAQGGIDKAIWMWPIEQIVKVVEALYVARDQAKQAVFEFTGVADIQRGQTDPNETLGAQQLKAQWGSLRLQEAQRDVQRYARDLYRMMADLMAHFWAAAEWAAVTDVMLSEPQMALMKNDLQREFAIEIETDSTIRADLSRTQQNISGFITGLGSYFESVGPAVQMGYMPPEIAVGLASAFARMFKLGREADDLLDQWVKQLEEKAKQPPQPPPPDPKVEAEKIKAQAAMEKAKADVQTVQVKAQAEKAKTEMDLQAKQAELQMKMQEMQAELAMMQQEMGIKQQELGLKRQEQAGDMALAERQHQLDAEGQQRDAEAAEHGHGLKLEVMDAQAKAKQQAASKPNGGAK
jgi:hypothetical protein